MTVMQQIVHSRCFQATLAGFVLGVAAWTTGPSWACYSLLWGCSGNSNWTCSINNPTTSSRTGSCVCRSRIKASCKAVSRNPCVGQQGHSTCVKGLTLRSACPYEDGRKPTSVFGLLQPSAYGQCSKARQIGDLLWGSCLGAVVCPGGHRRKRRQPVAT